MSRTTGDLGLIFSVLLYLSYTLSVNGQSMDSGQVLAIVLPCVFGIIFFLCMCLGASFGIYRRRLIRNRMIMRMEARARAMEAVQASQTYPPPRIAQPPGVTIVPSYPVPPPYVEAPPGAPYNLGPMQPPPYGYPLAPGTPYQMGYTGPQPPVVDPQLTAQTMPAPPYQILAAGPAPPPFTSAPAVMPAVGPSASATTNGNVSSQYPAANGLAVVK